MIRKILLSSYLDLGLMVLRLLFGLSLFVNHGWPTVSNIHSNEVYPDPLGIGSFWSMVLMGSAEFLFALFVVLGLFTRISAVPVIIGFTVAFFVFHANDPFGAKEMAYLYLSAFTVIFIIGPGKYSFDYLLLNRKSNKT